ncbi:MAG: ATP-binding cassette domain-containing protein [Chthoniobacteraceae bacterium]
MVLAARQLHCSRAHQSPEPTVLTEVTLGFQRASLTMLYGAPGCGKNLLLRVLGLLSTPDAGEVLLHGQPTTGLTAPERTALRNREFGYLFAESFLLPGFSVIENIVMPLFKVFAMNPDDARARAEKWLDFAGLADEAETPAHELPAPLAARVALARALAPEPGILLVEKLDEHAGPDTALQLLSRLQALRDDQGTTILLTAATRSMAAFTDRVIEMDSGRVHYDSHPAAAL